MTVHQPFDLRFVGPEGVKEGDEIRCEDGCLYATVTSPGVVGSYQWPVLEMHSGNLNPKGQRYPIRCNCGAVAIRGAA